MCRDFHLSKPLMHAERRLIFDGDGSAVAKPAAPSFLQKEASFVDTVRCELYGD